MTTDDDFELPYDLKKISDRLQGLRPQASVVSEADMLFECGRKAALTSLKAAQPHQVKILSKSFVSGLAIGLATAACCMLTFQAWRFPGNENRSFTSAGESVARTSPRILDQPLASDPLPVRPIESKDTTQADPSQNALVAKADSNRRPSLIPADSSAPVMLLNPVSRRVWLTDTLRPSLAAQRKQEIVENQPVDSPSGIQDLIRSMESDWR